MPYYSLRLGGSIAGQSANPFYNMFTFLTSELIPTSEGAAALAGAFETEYLGTGSPLLDAIHEDFTFESIYVLSPPVPTVLSVVGVSEPGLATGDRAPNFTAFEFRSPRTIATVREGKKRFSPVSEGMITDGDLNPSFATLMESIAGLLSLVLEATVGGVATSFVPIIVKRIPYETESGSTAYRLPGAGDPFVYSAAREWVYQRVTTQNSRKG